MTRQRELDVIRGKMLVAGASPDEVAAFLDYVSTIEALLDEADMEDYFGTEGWRHRIGIED